VLRISAPAHRASDDIVNLVGPLQPNEDVVLSLSNPNTWLILHPDTLLTATAISTSVPCPRKPLLQDRVKSSGGTSEPLLYGNLLHELFQSCLLEDNFSSDFRLAAAKKLTSREEAVSSAWELNKDVAEILDEVLSRSAEWQDWAATYVSNSPNDKAVLADKRALQNNQDRVCVSDVHDIEEDIWSPALGMKGKIDVSVQARNTGSECEHRRSFQERRGGPLRNQNRPEHCWHGASSPNHALHAAYV
jgi:DNA replication ATP-dependent helicase Dna2